MLPWIPPASPPHTFPPTARALRRPNGLLAAGGDLSVARLLAAYRLGIFPWFSDGEPILWWAPDPRTVLLPGDLHVSRSLARRLRRRTFDVRVNTAFAAVVDGCAAPRGDADGTWIVASMRAAYVALHHAGHAHSVECWRAGKLVGGLYGIAIGAAFFGESMFSRESDASKVALASLCDHPFRLVDCQVPNPHLERMGARVVPRRTFETLLADAVAAPAVALARISVGDAEVGDARASDTGVTRHS